MGPHVTDAQTQGIIEAARRYNRHKGLPEVVVGYSDIADCTRWAGRIDFRNDPPTIAWEPDDFAARETIRDIPLKPINAKPEKK